MRLLPALAPLNSAVNAALSSDPDARRVGAGLNGAISTMTQIGQHCSTTFARLTQSGLLHIDARAVPRDVMTDDPSLAEARLHRRTVRAPEAVTDRVLAAYDVVREHPIQPTTTSDRRCCRGTGLRRPRAHSTPCHRLTPLHTGDLFRPGLPGWVRYGSEARSHPAGRRLGPTRCGLREVFRTALSADSYAARRVAYHSFSTSSGVRYPSAECRRL
jgi:hypothetical protein